MCVLSVFLAAGLGRTAAAQAIRGTVADEHGAPVPGAIVVLLDSAGKPVAGGLAGLQGEFYVKAPAAGRYKIRIDRIGYASDLSERIELGAGGIVERSIIARAAPVQLAGVVISTTRRCVRRPEEGTAIAKVWDEARKALAAADLAGDKGLLRVRVARYERDLDRNKGVQREQRWQREGVTKNPFVSIPPESLATGGFVQTNEGGTWYYAPDAEVLVSEEFLDDYCFTLRRGREETGAMIGVAFEPAKSNSRPGIRGVLWVDEQTAELRHVDYVYTRLPGGVQSRDAGGRIEFRKLPTGIWLVQRWRIRMPVVQIVKGVFRRPGDMGLEASVSNPTVVGFRDEGGEVLEIMGSSGQTFAARSDGATEATLGTQPPATAGRVSLRHEAGTGILRGTVTDAAGHAIESVQVRLLGSGVTVATMRDGTFSTPLPPGSHVVDVRRLGYAPARFTAYISRSQDVIAAIRLEEAVQQLEPMVIAEERGTPASAAPGFAERKRRLNGVFVDRQRIDQLRPQVLTDLLRGAPGIALMPMNSVGGVVFVPQMLRAGFRGPCPMSYYVDGMEFEPSEQGINSDIRPAEIESLEVYQPAHVPAQFSNRRSERCGALVIWTRRAAGNAAP